MKVLLFNGSPRANGCTYTALNEVAKVLNKEGIETEILQVGNAFIQDCTACGYCHKKGKCVFDEDVVNKWTELAKSADGFIFGTPVYYAHPSGRILSIMDRMFYSAGKHFKQKPAAVIASARRAGTTASLDVMSKYLTINQMIVVSSTYWNMVHGNSKEEVEKDLEGIETMHNLAKNMAWILKCIELGKENGVEAPEIRKTKITNFIR